MTGTDNEVPGSSVGPREARLFMPSNVETEKRSILTPKESVSMGTSSKSITAPHTSSAGSPLVISGHETSSSSQGRFEVNGHIHEVFGWMPGQVSNSRTESFLKMKNHLSDRQIRA